MRDESRFLAALSGLEYRTVPVGNEICVTKKPIDAFSMAYSAVDLFVN